MFRVKKDNVEKVDKKKIKELGEVEETLQDWIIANPDILDEDILLIGSHLKVANVNDELDLLEVDVNGNLVIIELKTGRTPNDVDFQVLKYASYISNWNRDQIKEQFNEFYKGSGNQLYEDKDFENFNDLLEDFCEEDYELNGEQRIMLVAEKISQKIGSVLVWLEDRNIDTTGIEIKIHRSGDDIFLKPETIIPAPTYDRFKVGEKTEKKKYKTHPKEWHLEDRCSKETKKDVENIIKLVKENYSNRLSEPSFRQRSYITFRIERRRVLSIYTHANSTDLKFHFRSEEIKNHEAEEIKEKLNAKKAEKKKQRYFKVKIARPPTAEGRGHAHSVRGGLIC